MQRICALVAHSLSAACCSGSPAFPLHALVLPASNSLLLAGLGSLCEAGLVGLVEVLGLALLAVLSQQLVCVPLYSPLSIVVQPDLLRSPFSPGCTHLPLGEPELRLAALLSNKSLVILERATDHARGDGQVAVVAE
jgi:hypothetical protein